jgi:hypothetical protein
MQLDLFTTGIVCAHCNQDPGRHPNNPVLWNGFLDKETSEHVCHPCGKFKMKDGAMLLGVHYSKKREKLYHDQGATMSLLEFPVMIK